MEKLVAIIGGQHRFTDRQLTVKTLPSLSVKARAMGTRSSLTVTSVATNSIPAVAMTISVLTVNRTTIEARQRINYSIPGMMINCPYTL